MKIAVLLSGGVDSAVVVHKLYNEGHDLHLFYIRIGRDDNSNGCSADEDIEICRLIASRYGLPLDIIPLHDEYWAHVMSYALSTVKAGMTPHPDMMCNKLIKFGFFEERVGRNFDRTATGHYASILEEDSLCWLATAVDPVKDQTDFLARISYSQLSHLMFPLGKMPKEDVRKLAAEIRLPNATRKDSQGICFLGKIDYSDFLQRHLGVRPGPVIHIETGKRIGTHRGYWFYTIGQRKGLGLSGGPWYVVRKNIRDNVIYVSNGYNSPLQYGRDIELTEMHWITRDPFSTGSDSITVSFKNRHTPQFCDATLERDSDNGFRLLSETDIQGVAPGQFAIIYTPDRRICLGSGMISAPSPSTRRHHRPVSPRQKNNDNG